MAVRQSRDRTAYSPRVLIRTPALKSETEDPTSGTQQPRAQVDPVRLDTLRYVFNDESNGALKPSVVLPRRSQTHASLFAPFDLD